MALNTDCDCGVGAQVVQGGGSEAVVDAWNWWVQCVVWCGVVDPHPSFEYARLGEARGVWCRVVSPGRAPALPISLPA